MNIIDYKENLKYLEQIFMYDFDEKKYSNVFLRIMLFSCL